MGAIPGAGVNVLVEFGAVHRDRRDGVRREFLPERILHCRHPKHAGRGPGDCDTDSVGGLRHHDTDDGVARGRIGKLHVGGALGNREAHGGDDLVVPERCFEHVGEEIVGRDLAAVGDDRGAETDEPGRIVCRGIVVGDGAAQRAAVSHLGIPDCLRQIRESGDAIPYELRGGDVGMTRHSADHDRPVFLRDPGERSDAVDVDQHIGTCQTQLHRRQQRHTAGNDLRLVILA